MNRIKRLFGILGIAATAVLLGATVVSIIFYKGGFTPANGFFSELGLFSGGYFAASYALLFNLSLGLFGLIFGAFMVIDGLEKATIPSTALGFFGALTGVLATAQGIFTLNISQYHYIVSAAFYMSVFVLCALYVVFALMAQGRKHIANLAVAACAGVSSAVYAWYILSGSLSQFFVEDASLASRTGIMPFALVGWAAVALLLAFTVLYCIGLLGGKSQATKKSESLSDHIGDYDL